MDIVLLCTTQIDASAPFPGVSSSFRNYGAQRVAHVWRSLGAQVDLVDFVHHWDPTVLQTYLETVIHRQTKIVAFSVTFWFAGADRFIAAVSALAKRINPTVKIVIGGPKYYSAYPLHPYADYLVTGYSELALQALWEHVCGTPGLVYTPLKDSSCLHVNCNKDYYSDTLPALFTSHHASDCIEPQETLTIELGRGCIFACSFCDFLMIGKKKGTYLTDYEYLRSQIEYNYEHFGTTRYLIADETCNEVDEKLTTLSQVRLDTGLDLAFTGYIRADVLAKRAHQLQLLHEAGLWGWALGLETLSEKAAKTIKKGGMGQPQVLDFLTHAKAQYPHLNISATFIVGLPHDRIQDIEHTAAWCKKSPLSSALFTALRLLDYDKPHLHDVAATDGASQMSLYPQRFGLTRYQGVTPESMHARVHQHDYLWQHDQMHIFEAIALADTLNIQAQIQSPNATWDQANAWHCNLAANVGLNSIKNPQGTYTHASYPMAWKAFLRRYVMAKMHFYGISTPNH